jgi:hypothetical protein
VDNRRIMPKGRRTSYPAEDIDIFGRVRCSSVLVSIQACPEGPQPTAQCPGSEAEDVNVTTHLLFSAALQNESSCTSALPYAFTACTGTTFNPLAPEFSFNFSALCI